MRDTDARLMLLHETDNVVIARARIRGGETISVAGHPIAVSADLPLGHKLAVRAIAEGEKILKYGAPIGRATKAITIGEHVHVHNVKSDYTPTHHLYEEQAKHGDSL